MGGANAGEIANLAGLRLFVEILWIPRFTNFQRGIHKHSINSALPSSAISRARRRSIRYGEINAVITIVPESAISSATSLTRRMFSTRSSGMMSVVGAVMIAMGVVLYNQQVNTAISPQLVDRPLLRAMLSVSSCAAILASGKGLADPPRVEQA